MNTVSQISPEYNYAQAFVTSLTGSSETVMDWRCIHDKNKEIQPKVFRGTLGDYWAEIKTLNLQGYGCFVSINQLDGKGLELVNIQTIRAQFVDLDKLSATHDLERTKMFNPAPSFYVQSSPGKFHVYWVTQPHNDLDLFTTNQRKLAKFFDGDPVVIDATRIMRLPGTYHCKGEPSLVTCFSLPGYGQVIPVGALETALSGVQVADSGSGQRFPLGDPALAAPSLEWLQFALDNLDPNELNRGDWIGFTAAFKQAGWSLSDPDTLFNIWSQWCARYDGNNEGENLKQWNSIKDTQVGWKAIIRKVPAVHARLMFADKRDQRIVEDQKIGDDLQFVTTPEILTLEQMQQNFVFVANGSQVVNRRNRTVRSINDATNEYTASTYSYDTGKLDKDGNQVIKTIPAIRQWLTSDIRTTVDTITWMPEDAEFCRSPERNQGGDRAYNLWSGIRLLPPPENWQEWAQPFLNHVGYLVPDQSERDRFLKWCAHVFQHPGTLPHTCYLFVTKTTGTGRGTLGSMLTRALRGYVAVNMNVDALFGGFNGRISQKLLATVDEIREGNSNNRYEKQEAFKSKLTEETRAINPKYGLQSVEKNCCRWLMFSNHHDALPFDNSDRRLIVIDNPTFRQSQEYYTWLNGLLSNAHFIASIQQYLVSLDLTGFNPNEPAPMNAAKLKSLKSLETQFDRDAQQFAAQWPGQFATVSDLREFMGDDVPAPRALNHIIERAGMKSAHKQKVEGRVETVLIVQGDLTPEDIANIDKPNISSAIINYRTIFRSLG